MRLSPAALLSAVAVVCTAIALAATATAEAVIFMSVPRCNGHLVTVGGEGELEGTEGDDVILGSAGRDVIRAGGGDDTICGGGGHDEIDAGAGNDLIYGDAGVDRIDGGKGDDMLVGGTGDDVLRDGSGDDVAEGGSGRDAITLGPGIDFCSGGSGKDVCDGGSPASRRDPDICAADVERRRSCRKPPTGDKIAIRVAAIFGYADIEAEEKFSASECFGDMCYKPGCDTTDEAHWDIRGGSGGRAIARVPRGADGLFSRIRSGGKTYWLLDVNGRWEFSGKGVHSWHDCPPDQPEVQPGSCTTSDHGTEGPGLQLSSDSSPKPGRLRVAMIGIEPFAAADADCPVVGQAGLKDSRGGLPRRLVSPTGLRRGLAKVTYSRRTTRRWNDHVSSGHLSGVVSITYVLVPR